jgi:DNA-binding CsgD family transcriptional regulator
VEEQRPAGRRAPACIDDISPVDRARLRLTLASMQLMDARPSAAVGHARGVGEQAGLTDDVYAEAEVTMLTALVMGGDLAAARRRAEAILGGRTRPQCDATMAGALTVLALAAWTDGRTADALALLRSAVQRADASPDRSRPLHPRLGAAYVLTTMGEFEAAGTLAAEAQDEIDAAGDAEWAAGPAIVLAQMSLAAGRLDAAVAHAQRARELAARRARFFVPASEWLLAVAALHVGDLSAAAAHVDGYRAATAGRYGRAGWFSPGAYLWVEARLADASGDRDGAAAVLRPVLDHVFDHRRLLVDEPAAAAWLARTALAVSDRPRAEAVVACADHLAVANPTVAHLVAGARQVRALLDVDAAALAASAEGYRQPWARASALEDAAVVHAAGGEGDRARALLDRAVAAYRRAGAARDAARVTARIGDLSTRRGRPRRGSRPVEGWRSLTDAERRVARVIADGRTNAEAAGALCLSRHTVDFHLRQIFRKLGIRSRVDLARIAIEHRVARAEPEPT